MVLNAKLVIVARETPLDRVCVSNTSAGIIQDSGPHVAEKLKLKTQVEMMNAHCGPVPPFGEPGGNLASRIVPQMNVTMLPKLPKIRGQRRPVWSMNKIQRN